MSEYVVLLSVPGLRTRDLDHMPRLASLAASGDQVPLVPSFPCVTCPVQANMTTGHLPREHGVVANGFFWRDKGRVEMWTAWNEVIEKPQIWDLLSQHNESITSAVWFPLNSKGAEANYICTPAPIHNPDGSESLWCYTKPTQLYGDLRDALGHFPLQHFWGPLANIKSTTWIADSALHLARRERPNFWYIYLPHLDYAAQKAGPDSDLARRSLAEIDAEIGKLLDGFAAAYGGEEILWLVASEYVISPVQQVVYPNRMLREAGLLDVIPESNEEHLNLRGKSFAMVDHQLAHVFVQDATNVGRVADVFKNIPGIAEVLVGDQMDKFDLFHPRSGEIVLVADPDAWFAYYWWLDDAKAPAFARTVDIHRKPGYDPVELHVDMATRSIPLDAGLVKGSHGAPPYDESQRGMLLASRRGSLVGSQMADTGVFDLVLRQFGI